MNNEPDISFKIFRVLSLLPIIVWPLTFFMSIFFFDDPNANQLMVWGLFIGVNSYPLLLIVNLLLGNKLYKRNKILGYSILTWPILIFALLAIEIVLNYKTLVPTMGIKHRADSGFRKFRVVRKLCLGGQVSSFEMPYVSYPNLATIVI